jgi:hypothetical protein
MSRRGKGWHNQSYRHALASRGIETASHPEGGNITINVKGSETISQPARPALGPSIGMLPGGPSQAPSEEERPAIVTFEEDEKLDKELEDVRSQIGDYELKEKQVNADLESLRDEKNSLDRVHRVEHDELFTKLMGKRPGMFSSPRDLSPAAQKQLQNLKNRQNKENAALDVKINTKRSEADTYRERRRSKDRELNRMSRQVREVKEIRQEEQIKRAKTLEQTRTLNRLMEEGSE